MSSVVDTPPAVTTGIQANGGGSVANVNEELDRLLNHTSLEEIIGGTLPQLRSARASAAIAENDVSLVRRVAQGRLDIIGHEVQRRAGSGSSGDDLGDLLFNLPDILSGDAPSSGSSGRAVMVNEPGPIALALSGQLDSVASPGDLSGVEAIDDGSLRMVFERIGDFESELSSVRRQLHDRIDGIQQEIGRRYLDGEASVDSFLS